MGLLKRLIGLTAQKAALKQYWLEIGVHFIKKGSNYKVGQIISKKKISGGRLYVTFIASLTYDFETNKIIPKTQKRIVSLTDITLEKRR